VTRRPAHLVATALVAAGLLAGCSGADDGPTPEETTSAVPTSPGTSPPAPQTTVSLSPGSTLPGTLTPPGSGAPVPVPTVPDD
jgi:ABC-type Fe3+-hydroxamate transport system substrate-binding protein